MKTLYINGKATSQSGNPSVETLLKSLNIVYQDGGIAVACNNIVIPQKDWPKTYPQDGDKLTLIEAWQGG